MVNRKWLDLGSQPDSPKMWVNGPRLDRTKRIVENSPKIVGSVPYRVSLRWLFYRLWQDNYFETLNKDNAYSQLKDIRRAAVYSGYWHPNMITDEGRKPINREGYADPQTWLNNLADSVHCNLDINVGQDQYVMIAFEANAMADQFRYYTQDYPITLWPFGGDPSIPYKWEFAKRIEQVSKEFGVPVLILYFGDFDSKGNQIPQSAFYRIKKWCNVEFEAYRVGLNEEHTHMISPNFAADGKYQWEALSDEQAKRLIVGALKEVFDLKQVTKTNEKADEVSAVVEEALDGLRI